MGDIITFPGFTSLDIDPDTVLTNAMGKLDVVVLCGIDTEGNQYFASSVADASQIVWQLERSKWLLMNVVGDYEEE